VTDDGLLEARQEFDRRILYQFFEAGSYDNDQLSWIAMLFQL
jgi:hypothetical protein